MMLKDEEDEEMGSNRLLGLLDVAYDLSRDQQSVAQEIAGVARDISANKCSPATLRDLREIAVCLSHAGHVRAALCSARWPVAGPDDIAAGMAPRRELLTPQATAREALHGLVLDDDVDGEHSISGQALWQELLDGRWSVLDAFMTRGTRYVVAHRTPPGITLRVLAAQERTILDLSLSGRAGKWIACELHTSESTVTRTLRTALRRLGTVDTTTLFGLQRATFDQLAGADDRVALAVARLRPAKLWITCLSEAERAILGDIAAGRRTTAIAHARGTSPRTVSHQIANIHKKLGTSSRCEMLAMLH
jgi:DNA-binding NarL/FixJ family response regulator